MTNEVQLWAEEEGREGLVPPAVRQAVRMETVRSFTQLINALEPYATGAMGEIHGKLTELYIGALRQRALLVGAYAHEPVRLPVEKPEVIESTAEDSLLLGQKVLRDLEELESQMRKDGKF